MNAGVPDKLSLTGRRWRLQPTTASITLGLESVSLSPLVSVLLAQRNIAPDALEQFLSPSWAYRTPADVFPYAKKIRDRVAQARAQKETVTIFGDYDCDGVTAATIIEHALTALGIATRVVLPDRHHDGYGLSRAAVDAAKKAGSTLLFTADTGIQAHEEIAHARSLGIDVIVTDHHALADTVPDAFAIMHPLVGVEAPALKYLTGAGVALHLVDVLAELTTPALDARAMVDVAALGTVADVGMLLGENRLIVAEGLRKLARNERPGLAALLELAGASGKPITATTIGFAIAPRINAAGRMAHPDVAHRLLCATESTAAACARELEDLNKSRQVATKQAFGELQEAVAARLADEPLVVEASASWSAGIIGLLAGKAVERWHKSAIIMTKQGTTLTGSVRTLPGMDATKLLASQAALLDRFGGHAQAAGFRLQEKNLASFRVGLLAAARRMLGGTIPVPTLAIDLAVSLESISLATIAELARCAPFGVGNPEPVFSVHDVVITQARPVGSDKSHLKLAVRNGEGKTLDGIAFGLGHVAEQLPVGTPVALAGHAQPNTWMGRTKPQLIVRDIMLP